MYAALEPGEYKFSVSAVSLYGEGKVTAYKLVTLVDGESHTHVATGINCNRDHLFENKFFSEQTLFRTNSFLNKVFSEQTLF